MGTEASVADAPGTSLLGGYVLGGEYVLGGAYVDSRAHPAMTAAVSSAAMVVDLRGLESVNIIFSFACGTRA
jgi:hypothetical protein